MDFDELLPSWFKFFEVVELGSWPEDVKLIFLTLFSGMREICVKNIFQIAQLKQHSTYILVVIEEICKVNYDLTTKNSNIILTMLGS